jgi:hypothetical protein
MRRATEIAVLLAPHHAQWRGALLDRIGCCNAPSTRFRRVAHGHPPRIRNLNPAAILQFDESRKSQKNLNIWGYPIECRFDF